MNKIEKIKTEIDRLQSSMLDENSNFKSQYDQGIFDGLSILENFIDSLEQPIKRTPADIEAAMQEVEEKSKLFTEAHKDDVVSNDTIDNLEEAAKNYEEDAIFYAARRISDFFKAGAKYVLDAIEDVLSHPRRFVSDDISISEAMIVEITKIVEQLK